MDYIITALMIIGLLVVMFLLANNIGLIGKPISFQKSHLTPEELANVEKDKNELNIDIEKLRKDMSTKTFATQFMTHTGGDLISCSKVQDCSPEQLIAMAKRYNMNLDHYKINE